MPEMKEYQQCVRCVMDTTDPDIKFDDNGVCSHCKNAEKYVADLRDRKKKFNLMAYIEQMKKDGQGREYDCVAGISGGVDSCYVICKLKEFGLRTLAVHVDNGWNTELSVYNIKKLMEITDTDLYTYVLNWQEFRDLQLAFLKSSTPDCEIPTDQFIMPALALAADFYQVKYAVLGVNSETESVMPRAWSHGHGDWKYIKGIHKRFGTIPLVTYPYFTRMTKMYFNEKIKWFDVLNYIDYNKQKAKQELMKKYGWRDYGGKHYESFYTRFYQTYILPEKFGFDKRKMHLSSLIVSGQITREEAICELELPLYDERSVERDIEYFCEKMEIGREEFDALMNAPLKTFDDYPSYENDFWGRLMKKIRRAV